MLLAWDHTLRTAALENEWEESKTTDRVGGHGASLAGNNETLAKFRARAMGVEIVWSGWYLGKDLGGINCEYERQGSLGLAHCDKARRDLSHYVVQFFHSSAGQCETQRDQITPSKSHKVGVGTRT